MITPAINNTNPDKKPNQPPRIAFLRRRECCSQTPTSKVIFFCSTTAKMMKGSSPPSRPKNNQRLCHVSFWTFDNAKSVKLHLMHRAGNAAPRGTTSKFPSRQTSGVSVVSTNRARGTSTTCDAAYGLELCGSVIANEYPGESEYRFGYGRPILMAINEIVKWKKAVDWS